ncbi:MAG: hypothetical protein Cons2KO_08050 [Congregibacter sp.]
MTGSDDWKTRYLNEAAVWEASEELLHRVLSRVLRAAEGNSEALDAVLAKIQTHAKARDDKLLAASLDELTKVIRDEALSRKTPRDGDSRRAEAKPTPDAEPATRKNSDGGTSGPADKGAGNTAADVREVLVTLIDEVSATQPGSGSLDTLREKLKRDGGRNWHKVLDRVVDEIRQMIQRINSDKLALEQLMIEVSDELGGISQVLVDDHSGLIESREQATALRDVVADGVSRIQSHVDAATDISKLKEGVSQSLEDIRNGIAEFVQKDSARFAAAEASNLELQARVAKIEAESSQLREQLARNREKLMLDTLTGARSRMAYEEVLAQEMNRFKRYGDVFSLAVLDIDFFKRVNDDFGHAAGDKALVLVAGVMGEGIRDSDFLFRIGGEEFVLLLPNTDLSSAEPLVERVRCAVGESGFHYETKPVPLTISAGLTSIKADDTAETLFSRADDALYRAKKAGRDRLQSLP